MATKKKKTTGYQFANNIPVTKPEPVPEPEPQQVPEPTEVPQPEPIEEPVEAKLPIKFPMPAPPPQEEKPKTTVDDDVYRPTGPDTGVTLCAILLGLILAGLIFLIWHETNWKNQEDQNDQIINIDPEYSQLQVVVSNYVKSMKDPAKADFLSKIRQVYIDAAKSDTNDINQLTKDIQDKTDDILGLYRPRRLTKYEWEYQKLFDQTGVINTWLNGANIVLTTRNKKAIFTAIAEGLK